MIPLKKIYCFIFSILILFCSCSCSNHTSDSQTTAPEYVFIYAENQATDYPSTQGAYKFAELVKERTNGRIEIHIEPDAILGDEKEIVEQLQFGGIDFTRVSISVMSDSIPILNVLCMPYLYNDSEHKWAVLDGKIGQDILNNFKSNNLVGLSWYDAGARNFYTVEKPITCLEDLSQMRIRVQDSNLTQDMILALGGDPVVTEFKDVYSALQTKQIDGAENNLPSFESTQHYQIAKYYTIDEHLYIPEVQLCSLATWERLSEADQNIIRECAYESSLYERELWKKQEEETRQRLVDYGVTVNQLSDQELKRFQEAIKPLYEKYCSNYIDLLKKIKQYEGM